MTMIENQKIRPAQVIGPLGEPLTLDSLPPPSTTRWVVRRKAEVVAAVNRSEEHTSELQSLMRISYAVFCLKKKKTYNKIRQIRIRVIIKPDTHSLKNAKQNVEIREGTYK